MQTGAAMKTLAALSLFALALALLVPAGARAQGTEQKADEEEQEKEKEKEEEAQQPVAPPPFEQQAAAEPIQMPEPYQAPDPYATAADPSQIQTIADPSQIETIADIDWPQDVTAEEAVVDSYDDGYDPQAYTQFQDELAPYGDWIDDSSYGRVWTPNTSLVGTDFSPYYTGGHWALTEFGWTWVSDYSWGWAPFHYGRWVIVSGFGWCWVPGTMWGPAWVTWRSGGGWVGWAALPPRGVSVTTTYGHRSPWRFTRAADLGAKRLRCLPMRDMKGMFRRTTNVANDRVLWRGRASVHINAGPRYIPNAIPARLKAVAPHAFPQRAILPRPGANMSARPWIRAARGATAPGHGGFAIGGAGAGGGAAPRVLGRNTPGPGRAPTPPSPHHIYSPPPRTFGPAVGPHTFTPPAPGTGAPVANTVPRVYDPPPANVPRVHNPPPAGTARHIYNPPPASTGPRISNHGGGFNPPAATHIYNPPPVAPPRTLGTLPVNNPARVYNPPPRTFAVPPTVNPTRAFSPPAAPVFNSQPAPAARTFAAPPVRQAPPPSFHRAYTPPQMHAPAQRTFSPPAAPAGGSFGRPGGGMPFGGGHRR